MRQPACRFFVETGGQHVGGPPLRLSRGALRAARDRPALPLPARRDGSDYSRGAISVEAGGDAADEDTEDQVDKDDEGRGGDGGVERHPGDVPLVDEGGERGDDVEGFADPGAEDPAL